MALSYKLVHDVIIIFVTERARIIESRCTDAISSWTARDIDYNDFKSHCKAMGQWTDAAGLTSQQLMAMGMVWAVMYDDWAERP